MAERKLLLEHCALYRIIAFTLACYDRAKD